MSEPIDYETSRGTPPPRQALLVLRLVWAALLIGQLIFAAVVWRIRQDAAPADDPTARTLSFVSIIFLVVGVPAAFLVRSILYRAAKKGALVDSSGYTTGNIIFFAILEGISFLGLVVILMTGWIFPPIVVPAVSIALQAFNFPTGRPMRDPYAAHDDHQQ